LSAREIILAIGAESGTMKETTGKTTTTPQAHGQGEKSPAPNTQTPSTI